MPTKSYWFSDKARTPLLLREAEQYLAPAGFLHREVSEAKLQILVSAQEKESENYSIEIKVDRKRTLISVQADSPLAAAHGFHHVLTLLGFGFSFFADSAPPTLQWPVKSEIIRCRPSFSLRGSQPFSNFLNSPTTWSLADYERYLLTLWRWRGNFALFHNYDDEPWAAMKDKQGRWSLGKRVATSLEAPWGGVPGIPVSQFAHGTAKYFRKAAHRGAWGAPHAFAKDPIAAAQADFARVCSFARSLGIYLGFGFEIYGDPTAPGVRAMIRRRIEHVLSVYPDLHTLCLWEAEGRGVYGWPSAQASLGYPELHRKFGKTFGYLSTPNRVAEAIRLAELFNFAYRVAREVRPSIKVAFMGWGGDRWMRWGDFWPGLHEVLPADVALGQLDNIDPQAEDTVSRAVSALRGQREAWTIPWLESDAGSLGRSSQWHPQENTAQLLKLARSAKNLGYQGLLGIHWQTAGVEISAACLNSVGWNLDLSTKAFYSDYAQVFYSRDRRKAGKVAALLDQLESLGEGWTGTSQQVECGRFTWDAIGTFECDPERLEKLPASLEALEESLWKARLGYFDVPWNSTKLFPPIDLLLMAFRTQKAKKGSFAKLIKLRSEFAKLGLRTPHARRLLATMDFVIAYEQIKLQMVPCGKLFHQKETLRQASALGLQPDPRLKRDYQKGLHQLEAVWKKVFVAQAARLDTTGDLGNLVNLNIKAYQAWKSFRDEPPAQARPGF